MCKDCGCEESNKKKFTSHTHHRNDEHGHYDHDHNHGYGDHGHHHNLSHHESRIINMQLNILAKNNEIAEKNRRWLEERGIASINIISSPGSGKTMLLEKTLEKFRNKINSAVIVGDQSTDNDATRLKRFCDNVYQIETRSSCHLSAEQVAKVLPEVVDAKTQVLFIENVGNLICPAAFDLGESFKVAILSTTEGEDKPLKYPVIFSDAKVVVLTKVDLIPHLDWDIKKCREYIRQINPGVFVFELSAKTGDGMDLWIEYLKNLVKK